MRKLIALVTVMSLLLIAGLCLVIYGVTTRTIFNGFKETTVSIPYRSNIRSITPYDDGLALHLASPHGEYIQLIDTDNGKNRGRMKIEREDAPEKPKN